MNEVKSIRRMERMLKDGQVEAFVAEQSKTLNGFGVEEKKPVLET